MSESKLWNEADEWTERHPSGSRCFVDVGGRVQEAQVTGSAFVCGGQLLVRVSGVVGAVPVNTVRFASESATVCPACDGMGCFPETVDRYGEAARCSFCAGGVMSSGQRKLYIDASRPETDGSADAMWMWKACENPACRTRKLVRVERTRTGRVECNECWNR